LQTGLIVVQCDHLPSGSFFEMAVSEIQALSL
jgi:hypothetical protein